MGSDSAVTAPSYRPFGVPGRNCFFNTTRVFSLMTSTSPTSALCAAISCSCVELHPPINAVALSSAVAIACFDFIEVEMSLRVLVPEGLVLAPMAPLLRNL